MKQGVCFNKPRSSPYVDSMFLMFIILIILVRDLHLTNYFIINPTKLFFYRTKVTHGEIKFSSLLYQINKFFTK